MLHDQESQSGHSRPTPFLSSFANPGEANTSTSEEEEANFDMDEPPERRFRYPYHSSHLTLKAAIPEGFSKHRAPLCEKKQSLLTQALLMSPDLTATFVMEAPLMSRAKSTASVDSVASAASTAELTSDGGLTSPARTNTPSPPLPSTKPTGLAVLSTKGFDDLSHGQTAEPNPLSPNALPADAKSDNVTLINGTPVRKRCITFACGITTGAQVKEATPKPEKPTWADLTKKSCVLRFACPAKPTNIADGRPEKPTKARPRSPPPQRSLATALERSHRDSQSTIKDVASDNEGTRNQPLKLPLSSPFGIHTRHDFGITRDEEHAWLHEKPRLRQKITVADTLRKENVIRKLGEEAEEEALEEEDAEDEVGAGSDEDVDEIDEDDFDSDNDDSDGGNESDDEEGFADSDDESQTNPDYEFWTHGRTTAATSTDHLDHIRTRSTRRASISSIESIVPRNAIEINPGEIGTKFRVRRRQRSSSSPRMRPGTPELPDSTDFVCGTLDEDRPLEAAYLSCLEQRKIAKHGVKPQDLDPSFPTSDPEDEDDDAGSGGQVWVIGRPDESDSGKPRGRAAGPPSRTGKKSPAPSPKRLRSPPPKRSGDRKIPLLPLTNKAGHHQSPTAQRLFGHSPRRMKSPAPHLRHLRSPPPSRRPSISTDVTHQYVGIDMPRLAQRPNLTHTKSLPRTPNPFWHEHHKTMNKNRNYVHAKGETDVDTDIHSRGPIDIVQGLETKRQRRKEKFWRQHCRNVGKEKERRCQPGKGAERMRELGLEMATRCKAFGQRAQLVLSL